MSNVKTYKKHVVDRSIGGGSAEKNEDGTPVLGKCIQTNVRISPEMAAELNYGWDSSEKPISFYYMLDKEATERDIIAGKKKIALRATIEDSLKAKNDKLLAENIDNERLKKELENRELKKKLSGGDDEKKEAKELRTKLFAEAKELGLEVAKNIKTEDLQAKINEAITE